MKSAELLFKWPHRHRIHLLLPAALILAALAHAGIFFLFSVANPPVKADGIHPAHIYFLPVNSPELARLESTLASNDPALFAPRHESPIHTEFQATHIPQYASSRTALLNMPPRNKQETTPSEPWGPVAIRKPRTPKLPESKPAFSPRLTSSPELATRLPEIPAGIHSQKNFPDSLETISFFVGIASDGTVAHIVPNSSSGDPACDIQTLQFVKSLRFIPRMEMPIQWGFLNFRLGQEKTSTESP